MAEQKPNPAPRPNQGLRRSTTHSGVIHVRTYQSGQYVLIGNHLAQHHALSLTAIGLAAHILSVPEGTLVDIRSLTLRFPEGRDRIAVALRELEEHGYLRRVREHTREGRLVTRTYAHHLLCPQPQKAASVSGAVRPRAVPTPAVHAPDEVPEPSQEGDRPAERPADPPAAAPAPAECGASEPPVPEPQPEPDPRHEEAACLLSGLRRTDERLTLSARDVTRLAPSVVAWLERGASPAAVHRTLTADLPLALKHPAGVIAYRLRELLPPPLPPAPTAPPVTMTAGVRRPDPFQDCDGCERVFRSAAPGRCRDCRYGAAQWDGAACAA
ncbi:helix-turn-helix domain-containing protein [Streptomyces sp. NPDC057115]|uniref:helix-turn-helix domain-containing protein n=1 Tax=unclassified Streptomyces TaxID=2593676 RepID=UPI0036452DEC